MRRNKAGLKIYPWQALTEDRVSPELRQIIAKVARSEAKSYFQRLLEERQDLVSADTATCTGPHSCYPGQRVAYCRESCTRCRDTDARPCFAPHPRLKDNSR